MSTNATPKPVLLHGIETVVPEHSYTQEFALRFMKSLLANTDQKLQGFLDRVYRNSAIEKRHTVIDDYGKDPSAHSFYPQNPQLLPEPPLQQRNDLFIQEANRLSSKAVGKLLTGLTGFDRKRISHLITISCTGFSAPGFDFHLVKKLGLSAGIHRFHLGFMGCYAALPALKLARDICRSSPQARVLVVAVELCSLHFQQKLDKDIIVANSLFADGVAAALISASPQDSKSSPLTLEGFATRTIDMSEQAMAWKIGQHAFDMRLSVYVPRLIQKNIGPAMQVLFGEMGIHKSEIDLWAIHPGGRAILDKTARTLELAPEALADSYAILKQFGNMSSATILFVLKRILDRPPGGKVFATAFGPGLTIETAYLQKEHRDVS